MEFRQLRYFVRIVKTGSLGNAAQYLNIGVSALSQQMTKLENELSIRLLQRTASRQQTPGWRFIHKHSWRCATPMMPFLPRAKRVSPGTLASAWHPAPRLFSVFRLSTLCATAMPRCACILSKACPATWSA